MNVRRTAAVARKEMRHVLRDARSLAMALAVPVLMLLLFGLALSLEVDNIPTSIYDAAGHTQLSIMILIWFMGATASVAERRDIVIAIVGALIHDYPGIGEVGKRMSFSPTAAIPTPLQSPSAMPKPWCAATRSNCGRRAKTAHPRSILCCASGTTAASNRRTTLCPA